MTLRTAGLIAGVLGLILLAVGFVANMVKPGDSATPTAQVGAAVVVIPPEVLALSPDAVLTVSGSGQLAAHTARTQDVPAWTASRTSVTITGISDWDTLSVKAGEPAASVSPSPSPSASGSTSPSASAKASVSPSASASGSASPSPAASAQPSASPTPLGSQDIWRDTAQQANTYTVNTADVPVGLALVVESLGGTDVTAASMTLPRVIDDEWISQVLWWGVALSVVGLIALIARFIDVRPAQTKGEEWLAYRSGIGSGKDEAKPGSRRHRRSQGATMPVATLPGEPTTGSIPILIEEGPPATTDPVPLVALSGPVPPASAYQPPSGDSPTEDEPPTDQTTDDEEDRS